MTANLGNLRVLVQEIYRTDAAKVPYHGWHHVNFVVEKASDYVAELRADETLTIAAALLHDFNYLVAGNSVESAGRDLRRDVLTRTGFGVDFAERIEKIIAEARTSHRHADISPEAKALSDGDTAYKVLPTTPLMALDYLIETGSTLHALATKIVREQTPLQKQGIYFYSDRARQAYTEWAKDNLDLWTRVLSSLEDDDVTNVLLQRSHNVG